MKNLLAAFIALFILGGCSSGNKGAEQSPSAEAVADTAAVETVAQEDSQTVTENAAPSGGAVDALTMGMTGEEVISLLGEPTKKETMGNTPKKEVIEDWWFGENQKVRMIDGKVNHVVADVAYQKELFMKLVEAKKNNDEAEVKRIMEELTKSHK